MKKYKLIKALIQLILKLIDGIFSVSEQDLY